MRKLLGILLILVGLGLGVYVGIWVFLVGGIEDIVNGVKASPTNGGRIVWGILEVTPLAELAGGLIFWLFAFTGIGVITSSKRGLLRFRRRTTV